ncbi:MAG: NUDIX domain-containing protein [Myxococcota bacterium]
MQDVDIDGFVVAVAVVVVRGARVLALRRALTKDAGPGLWETVSGRLEHDEQPRDAAIREALEETGLDVSIGDAPVDAYTAQRAGRPMVVIVYRGDSTDGDVVISDEHDRHAWWTPEEFRERSSLTRLADAVDRAMG